MMAGIVKIDFYDNILFFIRENLFFFVSFLSKQNVLK